MTRLIRLKAALLAAALIAPLAAGSALAAGEGGDASAPQAYALRLPLVLAPDASLQRVELPAQVLVRLQSSGYRDIRVFNAQGQAVPMALASAAEQLPASRQQIRLRAYPVLGPATAAGLEGFSLRIEERQGRRVVQINAGPIGSADGAGRTSGAPGAESTASTGATSGTGGTGRGGTTVNAGA